MRTNKLRPEPWGPRTPGKGHLWSPQAEGGQGSQRHSHCPETPQLNSCAAPSRLAAPLPWRSTALTLEGRLLPPLLWPGPRRQPGSPAAAGTVRSGRISAGSAALGDSAQSCPSTLRPRGALPTHSLESSPLAPQTPVADPTAGPQRKEPRPHEVCNSLTCAFLPSIFGDPCPPTGGFGVTCPGSCDSTAEGVGREEAPRWPWGQNCLGARWLTGGTHRAVQSPLQTPGRPLRRSSPMPGAGPPPSRLTPPEPGWKSPQTTQLVSSRHAHLVCRGSSVVGR